MVVDQECVLQRLLRQLPSTGELAGVLRSLLAPLSDGCVRIMQREPHYYASTYPSERVVCRAGRGMFSLLCKYSAEREHEAFGHRGGLPYEAEVYRRVLLPLEVSAPTFYGEHKDPQTGWTWLVMECVDEAVRVNKLPRLMPRAAEWLARFHAAARARQKLAFLNRYDAEYYGGWIDRTVDNTARVQDRYRGLKDLHREKRMIVESFLSEPTTVIHGEFYPPNVLLEGETIRPVDWESAAVGFGTIDLVSLTEEWPQKTVRACEAAYFESCNPRPDPQAFKRSLDLARLYLHLRWLGDEPESAVHPSNAWRFEQLREILQRLL